jgi:hypothetical protein
MTTVTVGRDDGPGPLRRQHGGVFACGVSTLGCCSRRGEGGEREQDRMEIMATKRTMRRREVVANSE